jgi:phosphoglycolate phosphatase-like HAD superfamily hydrolase
MQLSLQPEPDQKAFEKIQAIIFDLHHTLSRSNTQVITDVLRKGSQSVGIDLSSMKDDDIWDAMVSADKWKNQELVMRNVASDWGNAPEDWTEANRVMFRFLGFDDVNDEDLLAIESYFQKGIVELDFEVITEDAIKTVRELLRRGYILGIATRRFTDPKELLVRYGIDDLFSAIVWTAVPGYAKPSPYSLIETSRQLSINPRLCAYVGNYVDVDVAAAKMAEMLPILTIWMNPEENQKADSETTVVDAISEILKIFKGPPM